MDIAVCPSEGVGVAQTLFLTLLQTLVRNQCSIGSRDDWPRDYDASQAQQNNYDFIVVGSGTAGSAVAGRLSENPDWNVLLIEAGGDPPIEATIPSMYTSIWGSKYDWQFRAEPSEKHGLGFSQGDPWPRGKMIGGSGCLNAMVYLRGFPRDFDNWERQGNPNWGYDKVSEVFERLENNQARNMSDDNGGHQKIDYYYSQEQVRNVYLGAAMEMGYEWAEDFNDDDPIAYTNTQGTITRGIRQSPGRSYLLPAARRPNLHVVKFATVTKLIMEGKRVVGVNFLKEGKNFQVRSSKEVILSAGSIGTPQILFNSGIGPKKFLDVVEIPTIHELAVGENLQDHVVIEMPFAFADIDGEVSLSQQLDNIYLYFKNLSGPIASPQTVDFNAFINTKLLKTDHPDIQIQHIVHPKRNPGLVTSLQARGYQRRFSNQLMAANDKMTISFAYIILANPKSTGWIVPRNRDPLAAPLIYPNYFDHPEDLETIVAALKIYNTFQETISFQNVGGKFIQYEGLDCEDYPSDNYWRCFARYFSTTLYHPSGTCKMGPSTDPKAVVDPVLLVHGLENLRVCDASIQPDIVSTNTNAVSIMIGERCADFVKERYYGRGQQTEY